MQRGKQHGSWSPGIKAVAVTGTVVGRTVLRVYNAHVQPSSTGFVLVRAAEVFVLNHGPFVRFGAFFHAILKPFPIQLVDGLPWSYRIAADLKLFGFGQSKPSASSTMSRGLATLPQIGHLVI